MKRKRNMVQLQTCSRTSSGHKTSKLLLCLPPVAKNNKEKKEKEVIALLQEEPWKMRQKPGLWGRVWCLRFFISPAGLKALFS